MSALGWLAAAVGYFGVGTFLLGAIMSVDADSAQAVDGVMAALTVLGWPFLIVLAAGRSFGAFLRKLLDEHSEGGK